MSRFLALDFETSGTDPRRHAPVSLGVALMEGPEVLDSREWIIAPPKHYKTGRVEREYDVFALKVSGLTLAQIERGLTAIQVCGQLADWSRSNGSKDLAVVAFNASFDLSFYSDLLFLGGRYDTPSRAFKPFTPPLTGPWQCARMIAQTSVDLPKYDLDTVANHFGFERSTDKHGALEDAILAGRVYAALSAIHSEVPA
jgi:DNA polymerase III epsilon subunit-like protein